MKNNTPLYDALRQLAGAQPLRMHMPGHKGRFLPMEELAGFATLDFTELTPTGNLYEGGGPIEAAEALWAKVFHFFHSFFLTGGSTQGVHTMLALTCRPGDGILLDRGCHRSAFHAMALLDLHPVYLERPWLADAGVTGPVDPAEVEKQLIAHPEIKTICITSPTYYGVLSDIPALAAVAHAHGAMLVVDAAHGAHLPFLGNTTLAAADLAVVSAHKTLPAPGQTALLLAGGCFSPADIRRTSSMFGTSSPSYPFMAALDVCRAWLEGRGGAMYAQTAALTGLLRQNYPALTQADAPLDPTRFVLRSPDGFAAQAALEAMGIYPEMADRGHVVFILTCADGPAEFARLRAGLDALPRGSCVLPPPPPLPEAALSPRQAVFAPQEALTLAEAEGRVLAQQVAPYPPGVPVAAPGERLDKKTVAYLNDIGYNMLDKVQVVR